MQHDSDNSKTSGKRVRGKQHECNTSVTEMLHERHERNTSATRAMRMGNK